VDGSENPLDRTRIHPKDYPAAQGMLEQLGFSLADLSDEARREEIKAKSGEVKFADLEKEFDVHYLCLKDILEELVNPWPDPREAEEGPILRQRQLSFDDLQPMQVLYGTVRKVVDFGAFVDVGVSEDGLVHISELSDDFVHSPHDVVSVGDMVRVRVVEVDPKQRRIALSMRSEEAARKAAQRKKRSEADASRRSRQKHAEAAKAGDVPEADLPASVRRPGDAAVRKSRRMQKLEQYGKQGEKKDTGQEGQADRAPDKETEGAEQQKRRAPVGDLLKKLDFAAIEKRGEQKK